MALTHIAAVRNLFADELDNYINTTGAGTEGDLAVFTAAFATLLVSINFQNPAFGAAAAGVITLAGVPLSNAAVATGTAALFRIRDQADGEVLNGVVATSGQDLDATSLSITSGQTVNLNALTWTAPV